MANILLTVSVTSGDYYEGCTRISSTFTLPPSADLDGFEDFCWFTCQEFSKNNGEITILIARPNAQLEFFAIGEKRKFNNSVTANFGPFFSRFHESSIRFACTGMFTDDEITRMTKLPVT